MAFGYVPDYKEKSPLKNLYIKIIGYPYPPRKNEAAIVFKFLNAQQNEKIIDIGCGDGVWYNELIKRGIDVTGIDLSDHDINKLKERAKKMNIMPKVVKADAQKLPFDSTVFDKAYSICTFEHIENDNEAFAQVNRVLKKGGKFIISIPMKELPLLTKIAIKMPMVIKKLIYNDIVIKSKNQEEYFQNFNKHYSHCRNYTQADIQERLKESGFKIEKISYNCRFFGSCIWSFYHTLKIFERRKSPNTNYKFKNEFAFAIVAPLFYYLMVIDRLLFWTKGRIIILQLNKK